MFKEKKSIYFHELSELKQNILIQRSGKRILLKVENECLTKKQNFYNENRFFILSFFEKNNIYFIN
jgi:hypothetical protein